MRCHMCQMDAWWVTVGKSLLVKVDCYMGIYLRFIVKAPNEQLLAKRTECIFLPKRHVTRCKPATPIVGPDYESVLRASIAFPT